MRRRKKQQDPDVGQVLGTVVDLTNAVFRQAGQHRDFGPEDYGPEEPPERREFGPEEYQS
jgi:hypothetical protein